MKTTAMDSRQQVEVPATFRRQQAAVVRLVVRTAVSHVLSRLPDRTGGPVAGVTPIHEPAGAGPVLLVHGLGGSPENWTALAGILAATGRTVHAVSYSPFGTSVTRLAEELADAVATLRAETGAAKVHLVGHSLGGVIIAVAFAEGLLDGQVETVVTIASPFGGSPWAHLIPVGATFRALRGGSGLLRRLAAVPAPVGVRWVALTATMDAVVPGRRSVPPQPGVQVRTIHGAGHLGLLVHPGVVDAVVTCLRTDDSGCPDEQATA